MSYPDHWSGNLDALFGDIVPLVEELVPTSQDGSAIFPGNDAIVNLDINYNNGESSLFSPRKHTLRVTSQL